ncbi:CAP-Gly domain-containing linker protein 2 [Brachionichthys hirsutus]|uniref:CAP-Gly domain-containing linker protein 2 n=1 Tax=Brachionichthys hirsutus TaxID=412623 RepID=UPI003604B45F
MLKSSGLKAPGRGGKRTCSPVAPKDNCPVKSTTPPKLSEDGDDVLGDFTVGEQVWVNGVKPGAVAYLGGTQFAPGQWAGVILNDLRGKNDGSVGGVRYFECQPLQGIFTRPSKLSRQPVGEGGDAHSTDSASTQRVAVVPLREGLLNSAVKTGYESGSNMSDSGSVKKGGDKDLRVGDRVLVGGSKMGAIRYIGETDFAKGEWCGVELDEPLGKNDGAVAGTRYFQCPPRFGLFAPVHKVIRIGFPSTSPAKAKKSKRVAMGVSSLVHSPSSSSISSVSSVASSVSGRPSRAGLLTETSSRYTRKISGTTALQEALKEKQQHIEQLLLERDIERAEMAKATSHICAVEAELSAVKVLHLQYVTENEDGLRQVEALLASTRKDKLELANQLEEERRKVDDLQFRVEEESITKGDLETQRTLGRLHVRQLEGNLLLEKSRAELLQRDVETRRPTTVEEQSRIVQLEEELGLGRAQIQNLQARLRGPGDGPGDGPAPPPETVPLQEQLASAGREHDKESSELREKYETALVASRQEVDALKTMVDQKNRDISELKQKVQQASRDNLDMMSSWKAAFDSLASDHRRSLEALKASPPEQDAALEARRAEHQLESENLKAKHRIQAAVLAARLQDQLAWRSGAEPADASVIEEKEGLRRNAEETMEKLLKREKEVWTLTARVSALEAKVRSGEKRSESLAKEKTRVEAELESMTKKSHDASGQLVHISQELLKKERSLNELRVLLLESRRHSRDVDVDLTRDAHKAEWRQKEQKLQEDIGTLREKLLLLGRERSSPDHRRHSLLDPSAVDSEVSRLRQRLLGTEDALRNALEHNQQVDQLVRAMRTHPDKSPVSPAPAANSANGIHPESDRPPDVGSALM